MAQGQEPELLSKRVDDFAIRLATYKDYKGTQVLALCLARDGFTYDAYSRQIFCEKCGVRLALDTDKFFDPMAAHQLHSNNACPFLINPPMRTGNFNLDDLVWEMNILNTTATIEPHPQVLTLGEVSDSAVEDAMTRNISATYSELKEANLSADRYIVYDKVEVDPDDMAYEASRRARFVVSNFFSERLAALLAVQGLFVTAINPRVLRCKFCGFMYYVDDDEEDDKVLKVHGRLSKECPLLRGCGSAFNYADIKSGLCWGFPAAEDSTSKRNYFGISLQKPECRAMALHDVRLQTFITYPDDGSNMDVEKLSKAGYYYIGEDQVQCFWCGGKSKDWDLREDPWIRHARTSPNCHFLVLQRGPNFAKSVIEEHGAYLPAPPQPPRGITKEETMPRYDSPIYQDAVDMGLVDGDTARRIVRRRLIQGLPDLKSRAEVVRAAQELNALPPHRNEEPYVPQVVEPRGGRQGARLHTPGDEASVSAGESASADPGASARPGTPARPRTPVRPSTAVDPSASARPRISAEPSTAVDPSASAGPRTPTGASRSAGGSESAGVSTAEDIADERREALELRQELLCKVCLAEPIGIVFLPCGHFACCVNCAVAMANCPMCRVAVKGTLKANYPTNA